jgi:hypothetical protein
MDINMILFRVNCRLQRLRLSVLIAVAVVLGAFWCARQFQKSNTSANPWDGSKRSPFGRTEDDPISAFAGSVDLIGAPDFALAIGYGGHSGHNAIRIGSDGRCRYIYLETVEVTKPDGRIGLEHRWRGRDFEVGRQPVTDLRKLLVEIDFFRLKSAYRGHVIDGAHGWATVQASGKRKRVYCINDSPEAIQKLFNFICTEAEKELQNAPLIDIDLEKEELVTTWRQYEAYVQASP